MFPTSVGVFPMDPVVIAGGGLSGLAAAVGLSSHAIPVLLLEQRRTLGGRAYSFRDTETGETIDNGQHVLIAGYDRTIGFLETIGTRHLLSVQGRPTLLFHHPERGFREFSLPFLPPPWNLAMGVLTSDLLPLADRWRMLRAGYDIQKMSVEREEAVAELTVDAWLDSIGQSAESKRSFWEPLAVSIMNEHINRASAAVLVHSLRTAFLGRRDTASLALPTVGLSTLYVDAAVHYITSRRSIVRCNAGVSGLRVTSGAVSHVLLRDRTVIPCSAAILALPPKDTYALLPQELRQNPSLEGILGLEVSPIISIHLWFETDFMPQQVLALVGRRVQWVFNRRKICGDRREEGGHLSATISAAHDLVGMTNEAIIRIATEELTGVFGADALRPLRALVIREKRATFSPTPAAERLRPDQRTSISNLFLAGDWTATGYPATIEGAVMSADRCVELTCNILRARNVAFYG